MKKLLVVGLIVLLSAFAFAGKLSFSGSVDVTPWVEFELTANSFQAEGSSFGKNLDFSVTGTANSDYGYVSFSWASTDVSEAWIKTPLVEATDVSLILQGGKFSVEDSAGGGISVSKDYNIANMLILDYKDALTVKTVFELDSSAVDPVVVDIYSQMLVLDPVYLFVDLLDLGTATPTLAVMGSVDADKEAGLPLGFAGKVEIGDLNGTPEVSSWAVGGWFDFSDPLSVTWTLYSDPDSPSNALEFNAFKGDVSVDGIEMLKGDWTFSTSFSFSDTSFEIESFEFDGTYSHVNDNEISYYPSILVTLPTGTDTTATVKLSVEAEFTFELPYPESGE